MYNNDGTKFEHQMIDATNQKKITELNGNLQHIIRVMYPNVSNEDIIYSEHCDPTGKPDIKFTINGISHYLSLKTGTAKAVHSEQFEKFLLKVERMGVPDSTIETLKLYQFGDETVDGNGEVRFGYEELYPKLASKIRIANEYLNESQDKMIEFVDLVVFRGNDVTKFPADYIYHGNIEYGVICSRRQIIKHLRRKNYDYMRNLHIGPIQFHPYGRFVDFQSKNDFKRHITNFKWVNFAADLEYISSHYPNI